jgi:hypothetical protein
MRPIGLALVFAGIAQFAVAQPGRESTSSGQPSVQAAKELDVNASGWLDTGLEVRAGDQIQFTATGTVQLGNGRTAGPEGAPRGFRDLLKSYPVNEAGLGALIGRIGSDDAAVPFLIGPTRQIQIPRAGRLFLGVNESNFDHPSGSFHVKAVFTSRGPEKAVIPSNLKLPEITRDVLDRIPRRVTDMQGSPGDNTNFVIAGNEQSVLKVFDAAGWVKVDRERKDAVLHTIIATLSKQAYTELPMSELYLFGRPQDYGLAHAEPLAVVAQRHHLRLWKAPFQVGGQELWVGAATHDIGFERDQRNNGVTHKIDPNVDDERDFVQRSLEDTGLIVKSELILPSQPSKEARTATGGAFHSDGRVLVLYLLPETPSAGGGSGDVKFANLFCSVREKENPDGGDWSACDQYIEPAAAARTELTAIPNKYRVLIVPGFFSACASSTAPVFAEGVEHLRTRHGLAVETWIPPNDSSENNGAAIAQYLREHIASDSRKYIVIGYSKGAPDLQTALALNSGAKDAVAAFISVAGAIGGSPIADALPAQAKAWIDRFHLGGCQGDIATAFASLKRTVRQAFLAAHPDPVVPSYSLPAVSDRAHTSKALLESWILMSALASRQDSQLAFDDAIIPGSKLLGPAHGDHLAVAMPFEKAADASIRAFADQGHYPRAALLESLVRYVISDLESRP